MDTITTQPLYAEHYIVAALPPEAEKLRRETAIINNPTFKERIGSDFYEIYSDNPNTFWVITETYAFRVDIEIVPLKDMIGPGTIVLHFGDIVPR